MKKLFFMFTLLGLFALSVPRDATAVTEPGEYPGTYIICGHICFCWDAWDYIVWQGEFCEYP